MALKDTWVNRVDGVDDASAEDINEVAHAVIDLEENQPEELIIDFEMSDISTNPVQNNVVKSYIDQQIDLLKSERKLKILKTITLEEDVESLNVEFDKPLDEIAILFDVAFLVAETKAMAARTDSGLWYMFYSGGAMKTTNQYFFVHSKELSERQWETFASGAFFGGLQGISNSTTTPKYIISSRTGLAKSRFVKDLNIFIPQNTSENAFAAGSTIQIWGHETDEE